MNEIDERDEAMRETVKHVRRVQELMGECLLNLHNRSRIHDASKFSPEEWPYFAQATSRLRGITYGSPEYKASLQAIKPGIEHHQQNNSHHPEYHANGVRGMSLMDLVEMLADWKAAGERHADGSLEKSIQHNAERFNIPDPIVLLLRLTANELGWLPLK
jgi:hypothetical protein